MTVTLDLTSTLIILFIIHTIFTHLLNWMIRETPNHDLQGLTVVLVLIEVIMCILFIINLTT